MQGLAWRSSYLENILFARRKGFWLGVRVEIGHGADAAEATGLTWERTNESVHKLAGRWRPPYHPVAFFLLITFSSRVRKRAALTPPPLVRGATAPGASPPTRTHTNTHTPSHVWGAHTLRPASRTRGAGARLPAASAPGRRRDYSFRRGHRSAPPAAWARPGPRAPSRHARAPR